MRQIPPAAIIEMALDEMTKIDPDTFLNQRKELETAMHPDVGCSFETGYALGLETARMMLRQSTLLQLKQIKPEELL